MHHRYIYIYIYSLTDGCAGKGAVKHPGGMFLALVVPQMRVWGTTNARSPWGVVF